MKTKIYFKFNNQPLALIVDHSFPMTRGLMAICIMMNYVNVRYQCSNREKVEDQIDRNEKAIFLCERNYPSYQPHPLHEGVITDAYFITSKKS